MQVPPSQVSTAEENIAASILIIFCISCISSVIVFFRSFCLFVCFLLVSAHDIVGLSVKECWQENSQWQRKITIVSLMEKMVMWKLFLYPVEYFGVQFSVLMFSGSKSLWLPDKMGSKPTSVYNFLKIKTNIIATICMYINCIWVNLNHFKNRWIY